ncbi:hypothetical protein GCM10025868_30200 [Angustibacter aerolatus]|uniref:DAC domain-containing protein n=1 Tax=Angustibacter aerolatus TaxID=1162965 RepID=A0ABQ6JKI9_9ACTN|nr:DNA integrity scanning diadenylate cyclase DisA [Angustibacter aerolatus]GMA87770.1 hypothetical protein GCM10025868_30200 [Angustibacter aerolatus]
MQHDGPGGERWRRRRATTTWCWPPSRPSPPAPSLRDGLERILRGRTGALIVLGFDRTVDSIATGGFPLDVEFSATRLREPAKMDGAIVCDREASRILRAATRLLPDPSIETAESGTRHRTAERVAKQTGYPVISVSQSMRIVALYVGNRRHVLEDSSAILSRANQALATLERYKAAPRRGDRHALGARDRGPRHRARRRRRRPAPRDGRPDQRRDRRVRRRASAPTAGCSPCRLEEAHRRPRRRPRARRARLPRAGRRRRRRRRDARPARSLTSTDLLDLASVARIMGYSTVGDALDAAVSPHGYRLLSKVPRLPGAIVDRLVEHFGSLQKPARRRPRGPHGRRRRRRGPGPRRPRGAVAARRVEHPGALRLTCWSRCCAGTTSTHETCPGAPPTGRRGACWSAR